MENIVNNEQQARALLSPKWKKKALVEVWCPKRQHRTGKAYWLAELGERLAIRGWKERWATFPLAPGFDKDGVHIDMRCACGTSVVNRIQVREALTAALADSETRSIIATWTFHPIAGPASR
jgi:hypothetical protein